MAATVAPRSPVQDWRAFFEAYRACMEAAKDVSPLLELAAFREWQFLLLRLFEDSISVGETAGSSPFASLLEGFPEHEEVLLAEVRSVTATLVVATDAVRRGVVPRQGWFKTLLTGFEPSWKKKERQKEAIRRALKPAIKSAGTLADSAKELATSDPRLKALLGLVKEGSEITAEILDMPGPPARP